MPFPYPGSERTLLSRFRACSSRLQIADKGVWVQTAWGTREGADADADDRLRMEPPPYTPFPPSSSSIVGEFDTTPHMRQVRKGSSDEPLIFFESEKMFA